MSFPIKLIHFFILFSLIISFFISVNLGWFPSDKLLTKFPKEISFSFKNNGKINNLYYSKGDTVLNGVVLATIYNNDLDKLEVKENLLNKKFKILDKALINLPVEQRRVIANLIAKSYTQSLKKFKESSTYQY